MAQSLWGAGASQPAPAVEVFGFHLAPLDMRQHSAITSKQSQSSVSWFG